MSCTILKLYNQSINIHAQQHLNEGPEIKSNHNVISLEHKLISVSIGAYKFSNKYKR